MRTIILKTILLLSLFIILACEKNESDNNNPTVEITSPDEGDQYEQGQNVTIIADANDVDGNLQKVKFFIDNYLINEDTESPYRYVWSTSAAALGDHILKVEAVDTEQASSIDEVTIGIYTEIEITPLEMILVEAGSYDMGCMSNDQYSCFNNELPIHSVSVDSFYISKHEITNFHFAEFLNNINVDSLGVYQDEVIIDMQSGNVQIKYSNGEFKPLNGKENFPVIEVSWFGAKAFCEYHGGRLPTEAEWEFAARGGNESDTTLFAGGNDINIVAWYGGNAGNAPHEVGTRQANELGIYDMSGNVWEWCNDWYEADYYAVSPVNNPTGPETGTYKVLRGGIWNGEGVYCRVSYRDFSYSTITNNANGLRLVKDVN